MAFRLEIDDLSVTLGDAERQFTLHAGSWSISAGEVIGLTGGSGTGKTLLLELLGMLRAPDSGAYCATPLTAENQVKDFAAYWKKPRAMALCAQARAEFFGFVPQTGGLLPFLTVVENVEISQKIAERQDATWLKTLLGELGLDRIAHMRPAALSIGQRQRVAIARALAHRPFCVIADEPTAALDPENAHVAMSLLIDAAQVGGTATLLSSHDYSTLSRFPMRRVGLQISSSSNDPNVISRVVALENQTKPDASPLEAPARC